MKHRTPLRSTSLLLTLVTVFVFFVTSACGNGDATGDGDGDARGDGDGDATGDGDEDATGDGDGDATGDGDGDATGDGDGGATGDGDGDATGDGDGGATGDGDGDATGDGDGGATSLPSDCTTIIAAVENAFVELCAIEGEVAHVRIEGLVAPATHASTQVLFGFDEAPISTNPNTDQGQFKTLFYGGGMPAPAPVVMGLFEDVDGELESDATFLHVPSSVCFDIYHGSDSTPPHFVLWVDGENGAECDNFSTLTLSSAFGRELWWDGQKTGVIASGKPVFFRQAAQQQATVSLFNEPAIQANELPPFSCVTEVSAETSDFVELCSTDEPARHLKIEGLVASATHATTQVLFGFDVAPSASPNELEADQFQALFYGGGMPAPGPVIQATFGETSKSFVDGADFMHATSTVCLDVHDGSDETAPYYIVWVSGNKGANCDDWTTLTPESASYMELSFEGAKGAINKATPLFFRQSTAQAATVTVTGANALSEDDVFAATQCTTSWTNNTDYQPLCRPLAGPPRHIRVEDAASATNSHYFYLILGEPSASPSGSPSVVDGSGTFVLTGGRNHLAASATSFRFDSNTSTQQYDFGAYTVDPSTICLDLGENDEGYLQIFMWVSGTNGADCADRSSLTADNVVYSSVTDDVALWDAALASDAYSFIKTSNTGASMGDVIVSSEPAVR